MELSINAAIFPMVMGISIGPKDGNLQKAIDLPRGANLLYLHSITDRTELGLLKKYATNEPLSDADYEQLLKLFITNTPRTQPPSMSNMDFLSHFGVELFGADDEIDFRLMATQVPSIKADTWECIALDILRQSYCEIISCFDFGDIAINLGSWKTEFDEIKQSLLNALRSALFFTFVGFLHGDDRSLYPSFMDFFENEFYKRVALVHAVFRSTESGKKIEYLPLFDSFYNLRSSTKADLIQMLQTILNNTDIVLDERMMIKNRLIDGAELFHSNTDAQSIALEQSLIKPVVNFIVEIQTADEDLQAANTLINSQLHNQSINRSYYAMMHATKALLEHNNLLRDWVPNELNVSENHSQLERKLTGLETAGIITSSFIADFQYVKQKRWVADYTLIQFKEAESNECFNRANTFVAEIKRLTA
ncbi:HEPN domain-containing protein [Eubacteriales bacterium OttesenSCG-928-N13]|nr:HEPN domain-containing protein [Eubacteriales bacterium OttesenSCG-928-N13]